MIATLLVVLAVAPSAEALLARTAKSDSSVDTIDSVNPIRKITGMLEDMRKELQKEADSEEELFEKAMCICESGQKELQTVIDDSASATDSLTAKIEGDSAEQTALEGELKAHADTKKAAEADLAKAQGLREKESKAYSKQAKSAKFSLDSLGQAIPMLEGGASSASFMQGDFAPKLRRVIEVTNYLTPDKREKVLSFMDDGLGNGQGEPSAGVAEIVGVLKSMHDEMTKDLKDSATEEQEAARGFGQLKDAKEQEITVASQAIVSKEKRVGELKLSLVQDKNALDDAQTENADGTKYLANLKEQCETQMKERDTRKKMRSDEIAAISEAITILTDDDALDVFKQAVPSAALISEKKSQRADYDAFVQVVGGASNGASSRFLRARKLVARLIQKHPADKARMNLLLLALSGEPKGTAAYADQAANVVDGMIDGMVHVLHDEDVGDEHKKDWCANETETTLNLQTSKQNLVDKTKAEIEEMTDALAQTNEDIKVLTEQINALDKNVHEATEQRKDEHEEFVNAFATMDTATRLIDKAANRLEKFYSPQAHKAKVDKIKNDAVADAGLALVAKHPSPSVQRMQQDFDALLQKHASTTQSKVAPITIMDTPKTYEKKESGGVIGLMMKMKSDLKADMTEAEMEEKYSAKDYARVMKDAQEDRAADTKALNHKKSVRAETENKLVDAKTLTETTLQELQNIALYLVQLHSECDFLLRNYEVRHEGRVEEESGLADAQTIVTHEEPPTHMDIAKSYAAETSPKQVDEHFEGGHEFGQGGSSIPDSEAFSH